MKLMRPVTPAMLERDRIARIRLHNHPIVEMMRNVASVAGELIGGVFFFGALIFLVKMMGALAWCF